MLKNIEKRKKLFKMIVGEAKAEFMEFTTQCGPKKKPRPLLYCPRSHNKRFQQSNCFLEDKLPLCHNCPFYSYEPRNYFTRMARQPKMKELDSSVSDFDESREEYNQSLPLLERDGEFENLPRNLQDFLKLIKSFSVGDVAVVAKSKVRSLAWHPTELFLAGGDHNGNIGISLFISRYFLKFELSKGFWKDSNNLLPQLNNVHLRAINCLIFEIADPTRLFTSSADGSLISVDVTSA